MANRIDVELTSSRKDGSWTWRAAGAKQPKGELDGSLLPKGASVGDVFKVEVEQDIDGTTVTSVLPSKEKRAEPDRLEIIGPPPPPPRDYSKEDKPRRGRKDGKGRDRKGGRPPRDAEQEQKERPPRKPRPPRLRPGRTHRGALVSDLPEEQRPVMEQLEKGGLAAVRTAIEEQNKEAKEKGQPPVKAEPLVALAEELLPRLHTAEWRDRAEAAVEQADKVDLRDLRSVVVAGDTWARDDETRELAAKVRAALEARVEKEHAAWLAEIAETLADGRVARALHVSSRPPKAGSPLPVDMAERLATAAREAMTSETPPRRYSTMVEAVARSPVRKQVEPIGVPDRPGDDLLAMVKRMATDSPQIAERFGVEPAPAPKRPAGRARRPAGTAPPPR